MLLMVEKGTRDGICQVIHRYAKENNKYMKNYDKNLGSSYLMYLEANNLYGCQMSERLPVNGFEWMKQLSEFDERFIKNYDENNNKGYILEVDIECPKNLFNVHRDISFVPERKKIRKCNKLIFYFLYKKNYVVHIRVLKQALNHRLIQRKVHKLIQFNQKENHILTWPLNQEQKQKMTLTNISLN